MTVEELIEKLREFPPHWEVYYDDDVYGEVEPCAIEGSPKTEEVVIR